MQCQASRPNCRQWLEFAALHVPNFVLCLFGHVFAQELSAANSRSPRAAPLGPGGKDNLEHERIGAEPSTVAAPGLTDGQLARAL